jgi:hypothetical protein
MWEVIVLSAVLTYGLARHIIGHELQEIIDNWKGYRCAPHIMITANMFKPKEDPRSEFDFAADNFVFCTSEMAKWALTIALKPVLEVFYQMMAAAIQSIGFTMNLRTLASNLFHGLNRMFDVFARRFNLTIHELNKTFLLQLSAMKKANAVATAAIFAGIATMRGIYNFFQLMMIVCIAILVILVVLVIFLFFIMIPVLPMIIIIVGIIAASALGGAVGGMADTFCFDPDTKVEMSDGTHKPISEIKVGDKLAGDSTVTGTMKFKTDNTELYNIDGVKVSGSHLLYTDGKPVFVKNFAGAKSVGLYAGTHVICLNTSNHKIPVVGDTQKLVFADWEELDNVDMDGWDMHVREFLNMGSKSKIPAVHVPTDVLASESGFSGATLVPTLKEGVLFNYVPLSDIKIGMEVFDGTSFVPVVGVVQIAPTDVKSYGSIGDVAMSGANWIFDKTDNLWKRAIETNNWKAAALPVSNQYNIFTASGKIMIDKNSYCDFSDVGLMNIEKTYDFTLNSLLEKCAI